MQKLILDVLTVSNCQNPQDFDGEIVLDTAKNLETASSKLAVSAHSNSNEEPTDKLIESASEARDGSDLCTIEHSPP